MNKRQFLLLMLIPAIVILSLIAFNWFTIIFSKEILLKSEQDDSLYLYREDYVVLSYEISRIDLSEIPHDRDFIYEEKIYASLSKKEKFWTIDSLSHSKPFLDDDQVCMKGEVSSFSNDQLKVSWVRDGPHWQSRYFIRLVNPPPQEQNFSAIVSVDFTGSAVLKQLLINDEPVEFEYI